MLLRPDTESTACEDKGNSFSNLKVIAEKGLQVFTFKHLHSATGGFGKSNVIGHGAFGSVYRGVLQDGRKVAIKLMDQAGKQGEEEFKVEVRYQVNTFPTQYSEVHNVEREKYFLNP